MQTVQLNEVTTGLAKDLADLRKGKITNADARVRAQLGREILRGAHLQLEGMKFLSVSAKTIKQLGHNGDEDVQDDDPDPA